MKNDGRRNDTKLKASLSKCMQQVGQCDGRTTMTGIITNFKRGHLSKGNHSRFMSAVQRGSTFQT